MWFDLLWYLSDPQWPEPNLILLNPALAQTGWDRQPVTSENWPSLVVQRVGALDWPRLRDDLAPFLEDRSELDMLTESNLLSLVR